MSFAANGVAYTPGSGFPANRTCAYQNNPAVNELLIAIPKWNGGNAACNDTVTDSYGNTYTKHFAVYMGTNDRGFSIWSARNVGGSGANTVTAHFSCSPASGLEVVQFTGLLITGTYYDDVDSTTATGSTPLNGLTSTPATDGQIIFGGYNGLSSTSPTISTFTANTFRDDPTQWGSGSTFYEIQTTATARAFATFITAPSTNWSGGAVTFKSEPTTSAPNSDRARNRVLRGIHRGIL